MPTPNCRGRHGLAQFRTPVYGYYCDRCFRLQPARASMWGCRLCNDDACDACFRGAGPQGHTDLFSASLAEDEAAIRALAARGLDGVDLEGNTAMLICAAHGLVTAVETLGELGASLEQTNQCNATPLMVAAGSGRTAAVRALLRLGADPNAGAGVKGTALGGGAAGGHVEVLRALLAAGADREAANADGTNALHLAAAGGHVEALRTLALGATNTSSEVLTASRDCGGFTPLMFAADAGPSGPCGNVGMGWPALGTAPHTRTRPVPRAARRPASSPSSLGRAASPLGLPTCVPAASAPRRPGQATRPLWTCWPASAAPRSRPRSATAASRPSYAPPTGACAPGARRGAAGAVGAVRNV